MVCSVRVQVSKTKLLKPMQPKELFPIFQYGSFALTFLAQTAEWGGGGWGGERKGQLCIPSWNVPATTTSSSCSRPASTVSASDRDFFMDRARRKPPGNRAPEDELGSLIRRMAYRFCGQRQQMRSWQCTAYTHYQTLLPHSPSSHITRPFLHSPSSHITRPFSPIPQPAILPDPFPIQPHYQTPFPIPQPATLPDPFPIPQPVTLPDPFPIPQPATLPDPYPHSPTSHTTFPYTLACHTTRPVSLIPQPAILPSSQPHYQTCFFHSLTSHTTF